MGRPQRNFIAGVRPPESAQDSPALWFLFQNEYLLITGAEDAPRIPAAMDVGDLGCAPVRQQYLGYFDDEAGPTHCFSGEVSAEASLPSGFRTAGLRSLFATLDPMLLALAGRAKQIASWDRDHLYCGRCATPTESSDFERVRGCPNCGLTSYPRISPAIIIAVTRCMDDREHILLARNHRFRKGFFSVVAGFVEPGESLEECAEREVMEEVGIQISDIRYFGSQPWPFPNSLMVGFTARYAGGEFVLEEEEIADAGWFTADNLPHVPPKLSIARQLIDAFLQAQK